MWDIKNPKVITIKIDCPAIQSECPGEELRYPA
jgi:hypothetical protein